MFRLLSSRVIFADVFHKLFIPNKRADQFFLHLCTQGPKIVSYYYFIPNSNTINTILKVKKVKLQHKLGQDSPLVGSDLIMNISFVYSEVSFTVVSVFTFITFNSVYNIILFTHCHKSSHMILYIVFETFNNIFKCVIACMLLLLMHSKESLVV